MKGGKILSEKLQKCGRLTTNEAYLNTLKKMIDTWEITIERIKELLHDSNLNSSIDIDCEVIKRIARIWDDISTDDKALYQPKSYGMTGFRKSRSLH